LAGTWGEKEVFEMTVSRNQKKGGGAAALTAPQRGGKQRCPPYTRTPGGGQNNVAEIWFRARTF